MHSKRPAGPAPQKGTLGRLIKMLFSEYRSQLTIVISGMVIVALVSTAPSIFIEKTAGVIAEGLSVIRSNGYTETSQFKEVYKSLRPSVIKIICGMAAVYAVGLVASFVYTRLNAVITQGFPYRLRKKVFKKMQSLPVKYFDTHNHGDIMSHYTNDIDTLRQLISQALPNVVSSALTIVSLIFIMLYYSLWLTLTVCAGVVFMFIVTKTIGGNSARFFIKQQQSLGKTEGYIEEMINGQKVVKVFCHEDKTKSDFDKINQELCDNAASANTFANVLMPVMGNLGHM